MAAYYNEFDKHAAAWLRELITAGMIPAGEVDERDIREVQPCDLFMYDQCHFFAGIGGWALALEMASWPDDAPVWTGSCPCQPFSDAGKRKGTADARHLWPEFRRLIADCKPPVVFGEQVASKAGREWLSVVRTDLEALGYGVGAADLCAAGAGAPHIRQRLWWVGDSAGSRPLPRSHAGVHRSEEGAGARDGEPERSSGNGRMGDPSIVGNGTTAIAGGAEASTAEGWKCVGGGSSADDHWCSVSYLDCSDGKRRPIEPGTFPLAHGVPSRVGLLRGYGNAIVPQVAARFIEAYLETGQDE